MEKTVRHRIRVGVTGKPYSPSGHFKATKVAKQIEERFDVRCEIDYDGMSFVIDWNGPQMEDDALDFLRPDVLPPRATSVRPGTSANL